LNVKRPSPALLRAAAALSIGAAALLPVGGCSFFEAREQVRGNKVDPDVLKELTPGTSTRADATALLGSPTARATFDDDTWIYIGQITRPQIAQTQSVESQDVIVLTFDQGGVLQGVKHLGQDDAAPVDIVARTTPSPGSESSFLQQFFGGIGRVGTGGVGKTGQEK
jgi:outer membrane protein assembly factor BamE (lipoprotein component of BamABCDE complex)